MNKAILHRIIDVCIIGVGVIMVVYHMVSAHFYLTDLYQHLNLHLLFAFILVFLDSFDKGRSIGYRLITLVLLIGAVATTGYVQASMIRLELASGEYPVPTEVIILGLIMSFLLLEGLRRSFGLILPLFILLFVTYPLFGRFIPGFFHIPPIPWQRVVSRIGFGDLGMIGIYADVLSVSANMVFLFVVFGSVLQVTGGTRFFMEVGKWAGKKLAGGPALASVVTSSLVGMVTGSVVANIATTGAFTIPLMKKAGYKPYQAGAIEATASTGGAIMPPVMGVAAFIMVSFVGIPYIELIVLAAIPAVLYFLSAGLYAQFNAMKMGILSSGEEQIDYREMMMTAPLFLVPLIFLIVLLAIGRPLNYTMSLTIVVTIGLSFIRKETRPSLQQLARGLSKGAVSGSAVAMACGSVGMLLGALGLTALTIKIPHFVTIVAGNNLVIALLLAMVASLILGATSSSVAAYVLVALVVTPALVEMGLTVIQSHLFSYYFACLFFITPPVAVGALVAARMAGAPYFRTGIEAVKVAIGGFIVPYLFIWIPVLLLRPDDLLWSITGIAISFAVIVALQVVVCNYYLTKVMVWERMLFAAIALAIFLSLPSREYMLAVPATIVFILATIRQWWKRKATYEALKSAEGSVP